MDRTKIISAGTLVGIMYLTLAMMTSPAASAASPHFISASSSIQGTTLKCSFKEAGLGNAGPSQVQISCSADASATYVCVNKGGHNPSAANKRTITEPVENSGFFPVRNGQTTGTIDVFAPGPGSFSCPGGQKLALSSVTYTNVQVCDVANNICVPLAPQSFTDPRVPT